MTNSKLNLCTATMGLCLWYAGAATAEARDFRINQFPNGTVIGCIACHTSPAGGTARNAFGQAVFLSTGGSTGTEPFWTPALAALDSDGDGFCNGQELGDPEGDGTPRPGALVTNPGGATSKPANSRPVINSLPVVEAAPGVLYRYQVSGIDVDACQKWTFSKIAGPAWLTVTTNGLASGTPPQGPSNNVTVTVRMTDNGSPAQNTNQTYVIAVYPHSIAGSPFEEWQKQHFNLPSEAALAGPLDDADGDSIVNLVEYGYRLNPRVSDVLDKPQPTFNASQQMQVVTILRDDDPALSVTMEVADTPQFLTTIPIAGTVSDPTPGDGLKTWTFVDSVSQSGTSSRFARIVLKLLPSP